MNYDRIILDLIDRVNVLEKEVATIKEQKCEDTTVNQDINYNDDTNLSYAYNVQNKDTTKYIFNGRIYGKNRLVLAVVNAYVESHPGISAENLITAFDKSLQGSLGVVRKLNELRVNYPRYERRFFVNPHEIIKTPTGDCVVCNQWGAGLNIERFIARSRQLGFGITEIRQ